MIFVSKAGLEGEKPGVPSVPPRQSLLPSLLRARRKLLALVTHSWRSGPGLGFFFSFVFRKRFTNCFEHGGAGGV